MSEMDTAVDEAVDEVEAPEVEQEGTAEPVVSEAEPTGEVERTEPAEPVAEDGRVIPAKFREVFKTEGIGKELKAQFFENREFRTAFPGGVTEARGVLKVMADIGGSEGLAGLQQRATQLDQLAEVARTNPAAVLDEIAQAAPGRMEEVAVKAVQKWQEESPESYDRIMSGVVAQTLSNVQFDPKIDRALLFLEVGQTEKAVQALAQLKEDMGNFGKAAAQPPKPRQTGPDPNEQRAKELDTREAKMFDDALGGAIIAYRDPFILKEAEQWTRGMTLTERQKGSLVRDVTAEIGQLLQKDATWMKDYGAAVSKRDQATAVKLYQEKAAKIAPEIVKNVSRELFGSPVVKAKPAPVIKPVSRAVPLAGATPGRKVDPFDAVWNS